MADDTPNDPEGFQRAMRGVDSKIKQRIDGALVEFRTMFNRMSDAEKGALYDWTGEAQALKQRRPHGTAFVMLKVSLVDSATANQEDPPPAIELSPLAIQRAIEHWREGKDYAPTKFDELL